MASINDYLNQILNAIFGREVRGALHDGLKAVNDETVTTTQRQDHLEARYDAAVAEHTDFTEVIDARVDQDGIQHVNLKARLDTAGAARLQTPRQINGTDFDGSADITTRRWGQVRGIQIGDAARFVDGSQNVVWTLDDIGASPDDHTHPTIRVQTQNPNLNDFLDEGVFFFERVVVGAVSYAPVTFSSCWLTVTTGNPLGGAGGDSTSLIQHWQRASDSVVLISESWVRTYNSSSDTWSGWSPTTMHSQNLNTFSGIYREGRMMMQAGTIAMTMGSNTVFTIPVSFLRFFGAPPNIHVTPSTTNPSGLHVSHGSNTTTGFNIHARGDQHSIVNVRWFAIGYVYADEMPTLAVMNGANKMYIIANEEDYITTVAHGCTLPDGIEVDDFDFAEDIRAYKCIDGKITLDEEKLQQLKNEQLAEKELQELQEVLSETDAVALQWWEENELGFEHEKSEEEFQEVMKKRQDTRTKIRNLREELKC